MSPRTATRSWTPWPRSPDGLQPVVRWCIRVAAGILALPTPALAAPLLSISSGSPRCEACAWVRKRKPRSAAR